MEPLLAAVNVWKRREIASSDTMFFLLLLLLLCKGDKDFFLSPFLSLHLLIILFVRRVAAAGAAKHEWNTEFGRKSHAGVL